MYSGSQLHANNFRPIVPAQKGCCSPRIAPQWPRRIWPRNRKRKGAVVQPFPRPNEQTRPRILNPNKPQKWTELINQKKVEEKGLRAMPIERWPSLLLLSWTELARSTRRLSRSDSTETKSDLCRCTSSSSFE